MHCQFTRLQWIIIHPLVTVLSAWKSMLLLYCPFCSIANHNQVFMISDHYAYSSYACADLSLLQMVSHNVHIEILCFQYVFLEYGIAKFVSQQSTACSGGTDDCGSACALLAHDVAGNPFGRRIWNRQGSKGLLKPENSNRNKIQWCFVQQSGAAKLFWYLKSDVVSEMALYERARYRMEISR